MRLKDLIDFNALSFARICEKITDGEHFTLARYGDGEFNAILGETGENCDNHPYYPEMGRDLAMILQSNPPYYIGLHQSAKIEEQTLNWLEIAGLLQPDENDDCTTWTHRQFVPNAVFHDAIAGKDNNGQRTVMRDGIIDGLWKALQWSNVWIIGPDYLQRQNVVSANYVTIPGKDTYKYIAGLKQILGRLHDFTGCVVLISASMCAPIIVDYLYKQYGDTATIIDFGSVFDFYIEDAPFSRSFFAKAKA